MKKIACPCCNYFTFDDSDIFPGSFRVCPVCYWEDDNVQFDDPELGGGANRESLNCARKNYLKFGAVNKKSLAHVREPIDEELRE